ncbi:MAG: hypothetical protein KAR06_02700 [Deltaproteobacteria bacterium]|nr:hypothetical protein [Deltaproteobacteria bacterium]
MKKDDYVKIVAVDGNYRYGYITDILDKGFTLGISLFEEGESKIAFDAASAALLGYEATDYISNLTEVEKRLIPLLAAGYDTGQIALALENSPITIRSQLRHLRIKLRLDDRAQLLAFSPALARMIKKQEEASGG